MKCPYCGFFESKVIDSRPTDEGTVIRRRRECLKCQKRFTTYETLEMVTMAVVKKDESRQPFDRQKILGGIMRACEKRPVSIRQMESIVEDIENTLQHSNEKEVSSSVIGEMVMDRIKELDQVAYVRFASVYKRFNDIETFMQELKALKKDVEND